MAVEIRTDFSSDNAFYLRTEGQFSLSVRVLGRTALFGLRREVRLHIGTYNQ